MSHHVELLLPGAHTLIEMLDGKVETMGTTEELRASGALPVLLKDDEEASPSFVASPEETNEVDERSNKEDDAKPAPVVATRSPRKLHAEEERSGCKLCFSIFS